MKIKNIWSIAVSVSVSVVLAACSGNPVDEKNVVPKTNVAGKVAKKSATNKASIKKQTVASKSAVKSKKQVATTKPKVLTRAQVRAKKQAIAALGKKQQQAQARANYLKAQKRKKYIENQMLKRIQANRKRNVQLASLSNTNWLGRDRFVGSQNDQPVVQRNANRIQKRVPVRAKHQVATRSPQPVKTRSMQRVATRAKQPVRTRAAQPVTSRSKQPVRVRAQQPARSRAIQLAAQRKAAARHARAATVKQRNLRRAANIRRNNANRARAAARHALLKQPAKRTVARIDPNHSFGYALSNAAIERTRHRVRYDGKYLKIAYPWGDVPKSIGVCTDVVIRAYRRLGIDLQQEVHKDISHDFYAYPNLAKWGLNKPDPNIDHRRVYNLQAFFKRHRAELPRSRNPRDYKPGDLVTWMVGPNFPHIGVVVNKPSKADPNRLMIAHNIGAGPKVEDILFRFPMTGHYRYTPKHRQVKPALLYAKTPPPASVIRKQRNSGLSYAEILQANKILTGKVQARSLPSVDDLLASNKKKPQERIMLAHLDASIFNSGINQDAIQDLLK